MAYTGQEKKIFASCIRSTRYICVYDCYDDAFGIPGVQQSTHSLTLPSIDRRGQVDVDGVGLGVDVAGGSQRPCRRPQVGWCG